MMSSIWAGKKEKRVPSKEEKKNEDNIRKTYNETLLTKINYYKTCIKDIYKEH